MKSRPLSDVTRVSTTKVKPHENSFFPSPNLILGSIRPCDLWTVTAHANCKGNWIQAIGCDCNSNEFFNGVIGIIGIPSGKPLHGSIHQSIGPLYSLQDIKMAMGRSELSAPGPQMIFNFKQPEHCSCLCHE